MKKIFFALLILLSCSAAWGDVTGVDLSGNGLVSWWDGADFTNTEATTAATWTDRVSSIVATGSVHNNFASYPISDGNGGVVFSREGDGNTSPGNYFAVAAADNKIGGNNQYTILVQFTPSQKGTSDSAFYLTSGLVGAEEGNVVNDWGFGYQANLKMNAGIGNPDFKIESADTVGIGTSAVGGYFYDNKTLATYLDGELNSSISKTGYAARNKDKPMYIGRMGQDVGIFAGTISEVRLYNRALAPIEMTIQSDEMAGLTNYYWNGGDTAGAWADSQWKTFGVSGAAATAITAGSSAYVTQGTVAWADTPAVKYLTVGQQNAAADATGLGTVTMAGGTNYTTPTTLLYNGGTLSGTGTVNTHSTTNFYLYGGKISGSTLQFAEAGSSVCNINLESGSIEVGTVDFGRQGTATVVMNGGSVKQTGGYFCVGNYNNANGSFTQNAGTVQSTWLTIGYNATGKYTLSGDNTSTLNASSHVTIGDQGGGRGTFVQTGGVFTSPSITVGLNNGSVGSYEISAGSVTSAGDFYFGRNSGSNGTLKLSGTGSVTGKAVAIGSAGTGILEMTGGTLKATEWYCIAQGGGTGTVTQSGGTITAPWMPIGFNGTATHTITGGALNATDRIELGDSGSGTINIEGGTVNAGNKIVLGKNAGRTGIVNVSGTGSLISNAIEVGVVGNGYLGITDGTVKTGALTLGNNPVSGNSTMFSMTGGELMAPTVTGNITIDGGTFVSNLVKGNLTVNNGNIDVTNIQGAMHYSKYDNTHFPGTPGATIPAGAQTAENVAAYWSDLKASTPTSTGVWNLSLASSNQEYFAIVYSGKLFVTDSGSYDFQEVCDDGIFVYIDGNLILTDSTLQSSGPWGTNKIVRGISLDAGYHDIEIQYYEGYGGNFANLNWKKSTDSEYVSTIDALYPDIFNEMQVDGTFTLAEDAVLNMNVDLTTGKSSSLKAEAYVIDGILNIITEGESQDLVTLNLFDTTESMLSSPIDRILVNGLAPSGVWNFGSIRADGTAQYLGVPEPATWALLIIGLLLIPRWFGKRRS